MASPTELFLSHAHEDRDTAGKLATVLTNHRIPVFYSPANIGGAQQWQNEILSALQRCDWFAVLLSPNAIASMWVKREVAFAMNDPRYEDRIVPLDYRQCDLQQLEWLRLFQMIDFRGDFSEGCRGLLRTWGVALQPDRLA